MLTLDGALFKAPLDNPKVHPRPANDFRNRQGAQAVCKELVADGCTEYPGHWMRNRLVYNWATYLVMNDMY